MLPEGPRPFTSAPQPFLNSLERHAIYSLEEPLTHILDSIRLKIDEGKFQVVVGDDVSGRIPALILHRTIKAIYKAKGFPPPLLRFMAGSSKVKFWDGMKKEKGMREQFARIRKDVLGEDTGNKSIQPWVLLVTDTISTGQSMQMFLQGAKRNNFHQTVATVRTLSREPRILQQLYADEVVVGEDPDLGGPHPIYQQRIMTGVQKRPQDVFATSLQASQEEPSEEIQGRVREARECVAEISERLAQAYLARTSLF